VGAIIGIAVDTVVVGSIIIVAILCAATAGAKREKIDPVIFEDTEFASMSVIESFYTILYNSIASHPVFCLCCCSSRSTHKG